MHKVNLRDERGVAMVFEVVLVALVLSFVGLALWQANQHAKSAAPTAAVETKAAAVTADATAVAATKLVEDDLASDIAISAAAESAQADEFTAAANDAANLGGSFNDSDF